MSHTPHENYPLTGVEVQVDRQREKEPKCYQCVNRFKAWEEYGCKKGYSWPNCRNRLFGYEVIQEDGMAREAGL